MASSKENHPRRTAILGAFAVLVLITAVIAIFGGILFQEGNPIPVLRAVYNLEWSEYRIVPLAGSEIKLLQKSGSEEPLTEYLADYGWLFRERLGAALFYDQNEETLFAEARMLTRRYVIYELDREP